MSVRTTADDRRDSAIEHITDAIRDLGAIVIDQCCGHDEWSTEYRQKIRQSLQKLLEVQGEL